MLDPLLVSRNGKLTDLSGLWAPNPGFLVGTGPSLQLHDLSRLRERGVISLAVNNAAAVAPVRAWTFSDPQSKFHHGLFLDPAMMTFAPEPKLGRRFVAKVDGKFRACTAKVGHCPNTFGYGRVSKFVPETFFSEKWAHWGAGKDQPKNRPLPGSLCTIFLGLRLLVYLGVKRIFLLGVDHRKGKDSVYGFPEMKKGRKGFWKEKRMWEELKPELKRRGIELFDVGGLCEMFPRVEFDEAVEQCKGSVPSEPFDTVGWNDKRTVVEDCKAGAPLRLRWY